MLDQGAAAPGDAGAADAWIDPEGADLGALRALREAPLDAALCPGADDVVSGVPVYSGARIEARAPREAMGEWAAVLERGPGVFAVRGAVRDLDLLDCVTDALMELIAREGAGSGDHFAAGGGTLLSVDATDGDTLHFALVPREVAERWRNVRLSEHGDYTPGIRDPLWDRFWHMLIYALRLPSVGDGSTPALPPGTRERTGDVPLAR